MFFCSSRSTWFAVCCFSESSLSTHHLLSLVCRRVVLWLKSLCGKWVVFLWKPYWLAEAVISPQLFFRTIRIFWQLFVCSQFKCFFVNKCNGGQKGFFQVSAHIGMDQQYDVRKRSFGNNPPPWTILLISSSWSLFHVSNKTHKNKTRCLILANPSKKQRKQHKAKQKPDSFFWMLFCLQHPKLAPSYLSQVGWPLMSFLLCFRIASQLFGLLVAGRRSARQLRRSWAGLGLGGLSVRWCLRVFLGVLGHLLASLRCFCLRFDLFWSESK